ncbi:MAG TPA: type II toxin-antitoxin system VapC family toxin [Gaiellaceae bacterium]|jgi:predicted nucleic acid-binding protein
MTQSTDEKPPAVADASAIVRFVLHDSSSVAEWVATGRVIAPDLMLLEVANALLTQVRFAGLNHDEAGSALLDVLELPIAYVSERRLVGHWTDVALDLGLSAYDAAYVALASMRDAVLITADRELAASYERAVLVA